MPHLEISLWNGVEKAKKEKLIAEVTEAVMRTVDCPKHAVHIIIREEPKENWATGGEQHSKIHADK